MINYRRIIDISWPITEDMTAYKDKQETVFNHIATFERDGYRKSTITLSSHAGTHVDAPSHFLAQGMPIEHVELSQLIGQCKVLDLQQVQEKITVADLQGHDINVGDIILCKTKNSLLGATAPFDTNFIFIDHAAARFLADKKIKAIGVDYLGIERHQPGHETHDAFLSNNIAVVEALRLGEVEAGTYFFCCLPLKTVGLDGAPARAVLLQ